MKGFLVRVSVGTGWKRHAFVVAKDTEDALQIVKKHYRPPHPKASWCVTLLEDEEIYWVDHLTK